MVNIPGCKLSAYIIVPDFAGAQPIPLFTPEEPADRPGINTLEGWNAAAKKQNRRSFLACFGRNPAHDDELREWVHSQV